MHRPSVPSVADQLCCTSFEIVEFYAIGIYASEL